MKIYEVISLDLFSTLVYVERQKYDPWAAMKDALLQTPDYQSKIQPYLSVDDLSREYYTKIRQIMKEEESEKEFSNVEVLLNIFDKNGVDSLLERVQKIALNIIEKYFDNVLHLIHLYPVVHDTLAYLRDQGYSLVLSSNHSFPPNGWSVLHKYNLHSYFDQITFSGQVGWRKPSSRFFSKALSGVSCTDKQRMIHVGDDPLTDIKGAMSYGIDALWIRLPHHEEKTIDGVVAVIEEFRELPQYV